MSIELKYLAAYLPYNLKLIDNRNRIYIMNCSGVYGIGSLKKNIFNLKPILRPLSDLVKIIEHNNDKFVPINIILGNFTNKQLISEVKINLYSSPIQLPFFIVEKLFEWNFDVFGLIEKGLAIDINNT